MNITLDEIRSNAPEGATHYKEVIANIAYLKYDGDGWMRHSGNWIECILTRQFNDQLYKGLIKPL